MSGFGSKPGPTADFWHGVSSGLILTGIAVGTILLLIALFRG